MYDYVRNAYGVDPIVGQPVHLNNYPPGKVAPEDPSQAHYVMVRFDGWDHDAPCHPTDLNYLPPSAKAATGFDEDHTVGPGRSGRSIHRSHRAEGRNWAGD